MEGLAVRFLAVKIVSLLDKELARWSSASCVPKRKRKEKEEGKCLG